MNKYSVKGITLLEVMLVMVIASMIIMMSVRYYQSAVTSEQAQSIMGQITMITASADLLAQSTNKYTRNVSIAALMPLLPGGANAFTTAWGAPIEFGQVRADSYVVHIFGMPAAVCILVKSRLQMNNHYTNLSTCSPLSSGEFSYTYYSHP